MAFTSAEVGKCSILTADKLIYDSSFQKWIFMIMDSYGKIYEWEESSENLNYASEPTDSQVSAYVSDYLQGNAHATGGGTYSAVAPTQETVDIKRTSVYDRGASQGIDRVPGFVVDSPGNPN